MPRQRFLALRRLDLSEQEIGLGDPLGLERRQEGCEGEKAKRHNDPDGSVATPHETGNAAPDATHLGRRTTVGGTERPECAPSDEHQGSRQEGQHRQHREDDADGGHRAEALRGVELAEQQRHDTEHDGAAGGQDRLVGALERGAHGVVLAVVTPQLFAVARDEEQRVVGRRAHDEDEQDALALAVEREHVGVGEVVDDEGGRAESEHRGEEHQGRQNRASVDDEQDEQHHAERDQQQDAVDRSECLAEIGEKARRSGDVARGPVDLDGAVGADDRPDLVDVLGRLRRLGGVEADDHLHGLAALGRDRPDRGCDDAVQGGDLVDVGRHCGQVLRSGRAVELVDHHRRDDVVVVECRSQLVDLRRLRIGRKERRRVVLLHLAQQPGVLAQWATHGEPGQQHERGEQPPQPPRLSRGLGGGGLYRISGGHAVLRISCRVEHSRANHQHGGR